MYTIPLPDQFEVSVTIREMTVIYSQQLILVTYRMPLHHSILSYAFIGINYVDSCISRYILVFSFIMHPFLFSNNLLTKFHRLNSVLEKLKYNTDFYTGESSVTYLEFNVFSSKLACNRAGINFECKTEHCSLRVHED